MKMKSDDELIESDLDSYEQDVPTGGISRGSGVSVWRQIAETLEREVTDGLLTPGAQLPTESVLAERFAVNRHTVRRAIAALAERGYVRVEQGRGTFVTRHAIAYALGRRTRFSANMSAQGLSGTTRWIGVAIVAASRGIAGELKINPGAEVYRVVGVSEADGVPIDTAVNFFPAERFAGIDKALAETGSITAALRRLGVADYVRQTTRLSAQLPDPEVARLLDQPVHRPILVAEAVNTDLDGVPIQYSVTRFSGDRVQITVNADQL